ncbi:hypothetical protein KR054_003581 [Drosophila jambulina]|nr:hypothetical protein KR054_003581 [Drosophila jambulina]
MQENEGRQTGLSLRQQQCHLREEIFLGTWQPSHRPQQSVTARKTQPPWWFTLAESLFLLLLVKLLQL